MFASKLVFMLSIGLMGKQFVIREAEGMQSIPNHPQASDNSHSFSTRLSQGVCNVTGIKRSQLSEL